ncbi:hypothetical protein [Neptunicella sp. SCSIO 80796]|uniref:hypothetical protein n=1 Tax=Neptunicella plasticusilytica TaxID=3117012 RepID=UPI003A4E4D0B
MQLVKFIFCAAVVTLLGGCASNMLDKIYQPSTSHDELYLRGAFTWWEADEAFKVQDVGDDVYMVKTELIADGQPYEFRFVDKNWSPGSNCGYQNKAVDQVIEVNQPVSSDCDSTTENFKFTPPDSGLYEFYIDFHQDETNPQVYIKKTS